MHDVSPVSILIICTSYLIFVGQIVFATDWRRADPRGAIAILCLAVVFLFCALSGYASTLLRESYIWVREYLHWILASASVGLVVTNKAGAIASLLSSNPQEDSSCAP